MPLTEPYFNGCSAPALCGCVGGILSDPDFDPTVVDPPCVPPSPSTFTVVIPPPTYPIVSVSPTFTYGGFIEAYITSDLPYAYLWTLQSGPSSTTIDDPADLAFITISESGTNTFRCTATDSLGRVAFAEFTIVSIGVSAGAFTSSLAGGPYVSSSFVDQIEAEIVNNTPQKGPWSNWNPTAAQLVAEAQTHLDKLRVALLAARPARVSEYAADVAAVMSKAFDLYGS